MPFGFTSRWTPCPPKYCEWWLQVRLGCIQLSLSCPFRLLHTCQLSPASEALPRFRIRRSSSEHRRGLNAPETMRCSARLSGAAVLLYLREPSRTMNRQSCAFTAQSFEDRSGHSALSSGIVQEGLSPSDARMRSVVSEKRGNASLAGESWQVWRSLNGHESESWIQPGGPEPPLAIFRGQGVHREVESEGHEEKYRAVIDGGTPRR